MIMYLKVVAVWGKCQLYYYFFLLVLVTQQFKKDLAKKKKKKKKKKNLRQLASVTVEISSSHKQDNSCFHIFRMNM